MTGEWSVFQGASGSDLISLISYLSSIPQDEAALQLQSFLAAMEYLQDFVDDADVTIHVCPADCSDLQKQFLNRWVL